MRLLSVLLISFCMLIASTDQKIASTSKKLQGVDSQRDSIRKSIDKIAKEILAKERSVASETRKIKRVTKELESASKKFADAKKSLTSATQSTDELTEQTQKLKDDLQKLIVRSVTLDIIERGGTEGVLASGVIYQELLKRVSKEATQEIEVIQNSFTSNKKQLKKLTTQTASLRLYIATTQRKRDSLQSKIEANKKDIDALNSKKTQYKKRVRSLLAQSSKLKSTLESLRIIKESEEQKRYSKAQRERNEALLSSSKDTPSVRSIGSSYKKASTRRYRGKKTISPLDSYIVAKKYGTYTDPIYKIKIFNESVSLEPKRTNAKVKAVFSGKIILAKKMPVLNNVVIIEHKNSLHTIYAHLDSIAPSIKKGKRVKKGSAIGRVNDELMFQVTQRNHHIDPLQLIKRSN